MQRKQFTFYRSFWDVIKNLPTNKEKLQAFEMLCGYALDRELPDLSSKKPSAATVFQVAQPVLDKAYDRAVRAITRDNLS